ncbi:MAG: DEAD/DEAH box helicase [Paludibacteraceae bacterium]|nr:DEAD/DEAH box helicase [Paludibacteraceae bacterium]
MSEISAKYALVTVPLALNGYTYRIPAGMPAGAGSLVRVSLGKTRYYNGVITSVSDQAPQGGFAIKDIAELLVPGLVSPQQLELWRWVSFYYHCSMGEVLKAALPSCLLANTYHGLADTWYDLGQGDGARLSAPAQAVLGELSALHPQRRSDLLLHAGVSSLQTLLKHGYITELSLQRSRFEKRPPSQGHIRLTEAQETACAEIRQGFTQPKPVLLHGVASSGKTEIYMQLVSECVAQGKKALVLVPEIALTTQLAQRFEALFGDSFIAYHSKLSEEERSEIYQDLACGSRFKVVLGVRSALFLPWKDLGLLVVDEEQESSYK